MDFTKMSADEIRAELVKSGLSQEEANVIKGKTNLSTKWNELNPTKLDIPNEELQTEVKDEGGTTVEVRPDRTSVLWHDYVMKQFSSDELVKDPKTGNELPNVDGLRRVSELLIGKIISSRTINFNHPSEGNKNATIEYLVRFLVPELGDYSIIEFGGMADANHFNTDGDYKKHLSSIAETRAEGKALRKALGLKKIVAAEEIAPASTDEFVPEEWISDMQLILIDKLCKENDINVMKFINSGQVKYPHYNKVPRDKAGQMSGYLNEYNRSAISIPEEIKGYDPNWRN